MNIGLRKTELKLIDHFDDRIADLEGVIVSHQRKQDNKIEKILDLFERHNLVPKDEIQNIREIKIFSPPAEA